MIGPILALAAATTYSERPRIECECALVAAWDRKPTPEEQKAAKSFMLPKDEAKRARFTLVADFEHSIVTVRFNDGDPFRLNGDQPMADSKVQQVTDVQLLSFSVEGSSFANETCPTDEPCKSALSTTFARGPKGFGDMMVFVRPPAVASSADAFLHYHQIFGDCSNFRVVG